MNKAHAVLNFTTKKYSKCLKDSGFSMLETIFVAGLLLALAVAGLMAYQMVTFNAKKASVETAASTVYSAALSADADGDEKTSLKRIEDEYNNSQDSIRVTVTYAE
jgi:type II secretory pathway pseudopilin PulG